MKKIALLIIGAVGIIFMALTLYVIIPILNENWVDHKLALPFKKFSEITTKVYPNKVAREVEFAKVLSNKATVVENSSWPFITCKAIFIAQNPGTIHRRDMKEIFCFWGGQ